MNRDILLYTPQIIDDDVVENLEDFKVRLADPSNDTTIDIWSSAYINIADNDSKN